MQGEEEKKHGFVFPKKDELIDEIKLMDDDIENVSLNLVKCDFNAIEKDVEKTFPDFKFIKIKKYNPGSFQVIFETRIDAIHFIRNSFDKKILNRRFFIKMGRQQKQHAENWAAVGYVPKAFKQQPRKHPRKSKEEGETQQEGEEHQGEKRQHRHHHEHHEHKHEHHHHEHKHYQKKENKEQSAETKQVKEVKSEEKAESKPVEAPKPEVKDVKSEPAKPVEPTKPVEHKHIPKIEHKNKRDNRKGDKKPQSKPEPKEEAPKVAEKPKETPKPEPQEETKQEDEGWTVVPTKKKGKR